jgi:hypothetical protein
MARTSRRPGPGPGERLARTERYGGTVPEEPPLNVARFAAVAASLALAVPTAASATGDASLKQKIFAAFANVKSYKLTVLGSVRSLGVYVAPDRYQMTTMLEGKPIKTIIVGHAYWVYADGKWEKSGTANNLDSDIAGLIRSAKSDPKSVFVPQPDQTLDGKHVGTFEYTFKNGTTETCNYDKATYRVTRCKAEELTLLYSGYNDPSNVVANVK